jgi:hypothetical protein
MGTGPVVRSGTMPMQRQPMKYPNMDVR